MLPLVALIATGLTACAAIPASRGALIVSSPMAPDQLANCVAHVFDSRLPLVRRQNRRGGADIVVRDLRGRAIVTAAVDAAPGGSRLVLVSDHADRGWYERLLTYCVRLQ
ncbi:MAG: hypothetical protein JNK84_00280 [Phreatobacter sp.]|uniref:hypothetical protein n=1 Tax=Phreatobacter sp. TaxID=1966341 RepID=UPI001A4CE650|nr:hypothetical protein [Phreatobacter sp.]MBL8567496.1 hypothetical protein [Phreatobacter sp.]